ncbi:hypothetical protein [Paenibacillus silvisoli]|uniref:hypothetical protein n=1 Tax=Paenibacillus silvisoli TaxID=3110539 RepID=UPI002805CCAB|nr:hypothetical protein [Paenibacillus silvisoli]
MNLSRKEITAIQLQLSMASIQKYDRKTVWLLMRHIEAQEDSIERLEKSADHLQELVIRLLQKKPTLWQRIFRRR